MNEKKLGIFIPIELINNQELDWINKVLLSEIISLTKLKKGCVASNQWLANFLQIQKSSIHRRVRFLVEEGYIITTNKYSGKKCIGRIINHTGKLMVAQSRGMVATATNKVAHATINGSTRNHSMVAGSDPMNTVSNTSNTVINSVINTDEVQIQLNKYLLKKGIN